MLTLPPPWRGYFQKILGSTNIHQTIFQLYSLQFHQDRNQSKNHQEAKEDTNGAN